MVTAIISIIVGAIISYFIAKWQMKKNKIVHFSINSYDIGKGLSDEFPDFKLHFGEEVLADNVMVLKGGFMNVGRNDITGLKGNNDIKLILPDECKVIAFTISPSTEDLTVTVNKHNGKDNILNFGVSEIFKTDEYFKYTAIIETSKEMKSLHSVLKFSHRLSNTEKIRNTHIESQREKYRKRYPKFFIFSILLLIVLYIVKLPYQSLRYNICKNTDNKEVKIFIDPYSNMYVDDGIPIPFTGKRVTSKEFEKEYKIVPVTEFSWYSGETVTNIISIVFFLGYIVLVYYLIWGRNGHIMNVLKENEKSK